jgi:hypothetical protein
MTQTAPMLALLENLARHALAQRAQAAGAAPPRRWSVTEVALEAETVSAELSVRGLAFLVDGRYRVEARVAATQPGETRCAVRLTEGRTAGRVAQAALRFVPDGWVNRLLAEWLPGVRREGPDYIVSHRAVARALLRLEPLR